MSATPNTSTHSIKTQLTDQLIQDTELSMNLGQNIITTTEDKVRLAVMTHLQRLEKRRLWIAPAGIAITILAAFVTADFREWWLPAATWRAFFLFCGLASAGWLIIAVIQALRSPSVDDFVGTLRASQKPPG